MTDTKRMTELTEIRTALGFSQGTMAHFLELTIREYQSFEWGECEIPNLYMLAAERIALSHAVMQSAPMKVPSGIREEALALARLAGSS
jgi:DNA-binding XRE family transcriptional regulator